jgi:predicted HicB family RNase H-like nuclease
MRVNINEARTEHINIRVRPSIKRMAVAMAKAEERSLSIFISRLIEAEAKRTGNATEKQ